eukprot:3460827-Ditylum_brightwellii.AAC.1
MTGQLRTAIKNCQRIRADSYKQCQDFLEQLADGILTEGDNNCAKLSGRSKRLKAQRGSMHYSEDWTAVELATILHLNQQYPSTNPWWHIVFQYTLLLQFAEWQDDFLDAV